jgi:hypothetical protein
MLVCTHCVHACPRFDSLLCCYGVVFFVEQGKGVEDWMTDLESSMRDSMKTVISDSIISYVDTKR